MTTAPLQPPVPPVLGYRTAASGAVDAGGVPCPVLAHEPVVVDGLAIDRSGGRLTIALQPTNLRTYAKDVLTWTALPLLYGGTLAAVVILLAGAVGLVRPVPMLIGLAQACAGAVVLCYPLLLVVGSLLTQSAWVEVLPEAVRLRAVGTGMDLTSTWQRSQITSVDRTLMYGIRVDMRGVRPGWIAFGNRRQQMRICQLLREELNLVPPTKSTVAAAPATATLRIMDPFLRAAIDEAKQGLAEGGLPIGSVLVRGGTIIGRGHNRRVQRGDPMAHAEIDCLTHAGRQPSGYGDTVLYSTLMPCFLCSGAAVQFGVPKVVVGESVNFPGGQGPGGTSPQFMRDQGIEVIDLADADCIDMMGRFIRDHPGLWDEDIGR